MRERAAAERRRQEPLVKANADRSTALIEDGYILAQAEICKSLIARVAMAVADDQLK